MDGWHLEKVETQDQMLEYFEYAYDHIVFLVTNDKKKEAKQDGQKSSKTEVVTVCKDFLQKIATNLTSSTSSPQSKLMSLKILVEFLQKRLSIGDNKQQKLTKFYSCLASHRLVNILCDFAEQVDPNKAIHMKGVNLFPKDPEIGKQFIRIDLQLVKALSLQFPVASSQVPTSFKKKYEALLERRVVFPDEFAYITAANNLLLTDRVRGAPKDKQLQEGGPEDKRASGRFNQTKNIKSEIDFHYNKIESYISTLLDENDANEGLDMIIKTNHSLFENQMKKIEKQSMEVMATQDPALSDKFFRCNDFMNEESKLYKKYITNQSDYSSYITEIRLLAEMQGWMNSTPANKTEKKTEKPPTFKKIVTDYQGKQENQIDNGTILNVIGGYFNKLDEKSRSKSPIGGFRAINSSVSKEKASFASNIAKSKRSVSPLNKSNGLTKSMKSLRQSKIPAIFMNVPNPNPPPRRYEGRIINENGSIGRMISRLNKNQGTRRFIVSNFKNKSSLFQNQHIQIGYKSQPIFEDVQNFSAIINLELFIGNITEDQISKFSLEFKGDTNVLLYANPKIIESVIPPAFQNKQQLMVVPLKAPFPLLTMTARYTIKRQSKQFQIVLPSSVLKLASYMSISKADLESRWRSANIIRTEQFKLSKYIPPDTFVRWIPSLKNNTDYQRFSAEGSTTDYELFCSVILLKNYESLLKINVRPNLTVVIQLGMEDRGEQAQSYFNFYLESLQQFVKEVE